MPIWTRRPQLTNVSQADLDRFEIVVEKRQDGSLSGSATIGHSTLFMAGMCADVMYAHALGWLELALTSAELAYHHGQKRGLVRALELLQKYRPDQRFPDWVITGLATEVARQPKVEKTKPRGCHSREETKHRDYVVDFIRATWIARLIDQGLSLHAACARASDELGGDPKATPAGMRAAFKRFQSRVEEDPSAFYPLLDASAHLLLAATRDRVCQGNELAELIT